MNQKTTKMVVVNATDEFVSVLSKIKQVNGVMLEITYISQDEWKNKSVDTLKKTDVIIFQTISDHFNWDLVENVVKKNMTLEIVIICKEKSFDLAYDAIQHNILALQLAPVKKQQILKIIEQLLNKINTREKQQREKERLEYYEMNHRQEFMKKLMAYILDRPHEIELFISEINRQYDLNLSGGNYVALFVNSTHEEYFYRKADFFRTVVKELEREFAFACEVVSSQVDDKGIISILNYAKEYSQENIERKIESIVYKISENLKKRGYDDVIVGMGIFVQSLKDINISIESAFQVSARKFIEKENAIFVASSLITKKITIEEILSDEERKCFVRCLKSADEISIDSWFGRTEPELQKKLLKNPEVFLIFKEWVLNEANNLFHKDPKVYGVFQMKESRIQMLCHCYNWIYILGEIKDIFIEICIEKKKDLKKNETIEKALENIQQHFREQMTLEQLAEDCSVSVKYFSRIFGQQVGVNYIDYLTNLRLKEAASLLAGTNKSVSEISREVGYIEDKYFRKLFKSKYGVTPTQYRQKT